MEIHGVENEDPTCPLGAGVMSCTEERRDAQFHMQDEQCMENGGHIR